MRVLAVFLILLDDTVFRFRVAEPGMLQMIVRGLAFCGYPLFFASAVIDARKPVSESDTHRFRVDICLTIAVFFLRVLSGVFMRGIGTFFSADTIRSMLINIRRLWVFVVYFAVLFLMRRIRKATVSGDKDSTIRRPERLPLRLMAVCGKYAIGILLMGLMIMNHALFFVVTARYLVEWIPVLLQVGMALLSFGLSLWVVSYLYGLIGFATGNRSGTARRKAEPLTYIVLLLAVSWKGIFIYARNVYEARFAGVIPVILLFFVLAVMVYRKWIWVFDVPSKAIVMTVVSVLLAQNFRVIQNLIGIEQYAFTIVFLLCIAVIGVCCFIVGKIKNEIAEMIPVGLMAAFATLLVVNVVGALPSFIGKMSPEADMEAARYFDHPIDPDKAPDIYYILLDEYGGRDNLWEYYRFENTAFEDLLREKGFNISASTRNEESTSTYFIVPNLLNLDYVTTGKNAHQCLMMMQNPYLYRLLDAWGYALHVCSSPSFLDGAENLKNLYFDTSAFENSAGGLFFCDSVLEPFYFGFIHFTGQEYGTTMLQAFQFYREAAAGNADQPDKPDFYLGYFQTPHVPFTFMENGDKVPMGHGADWDDPQYYLGQLKWVNHRLTEIVDTILEKTPDAVILIQSDHGARHQFVHIGDPPYPQADPVFQNSVINCVYYRGEELDIEGLSCLNTLRLVFNRAFGTSYEMLQFQPEE